MSHLTIMMKRPIGVKLWVKGLLRSAIEHRSTAQYIQYIYEQMLNPTWNGPFSKIRQAIVTWLSRVIMRFGDPVVLCDIAGVSLSLPFSHKLPTYLKYHPQYSGNIPRLAKLVMGKYPDLTFIDIGANIGDTVALLRQQSEFPILCIEGDPTFFPILERNIARFPNVHSLKAYLGDTDGQVIAWPVNQNGTAYLRRGDNPKHQVCIRTLPNVLKTEVAFAQSKMLKIDTDGYDAKILRGATSYLSLNKPVIFFEYDPDLLAQQGDDGLSLLRCMYKLGYNGVLVYENIGDFMLATTLTSFKTLEELHLYFSGHKSYRYMDLCMFANEDNDLFESAREAEYQFFRQLRVVAKPS